jgi:hypothetical protein
MLATVAVSVAVGLTATPSASAADTVVLDTCAATVHGEPGQQIALAPTAITWQLTAVIAPLDPLNVVRPPLNDLWNTLPPIPIGAVGPTPGVIPGAAIADAVLTQLHEIALVAPLIDVLGPPLRSLLGVNCRVPTQPARPAPPAPQPPGAQPPASSAPQPGTTAPSDVSGNVPAVPGFSGAELAPIYPQGFDRNLIPGIPPDGIPYNYGPGGVPQVGNPGLAPTVLGLRATGTAQALPVNADDDFQRPVLLATLLLTLVGTQLIRTWVLRRAT